MPLIHLWDRTVGKRGQTNSYSILKASIISVIERGEGGEDDDETVDNPSCDQRCGAAGLDIGLVVLFG